MPLTPRSNLPIPPETGVSPDVPRDIEALAEELDNFAIDLEGTFAAMPDPASVRAGTYYWANDRQALFRARPDGWFNVAGVRGEPGDLKASLQDADHGPWLKADGRTNILRNTVDEEFAAMMDALVAAGAMAITAPISGAHVSVPDYQGRTIVGKGTHLEVNALLKSDGIDPPARTPKHKSTVNEPNGGLGHTHGYTDPGHYHQIHYQYGSFAAPNVGGIAWREENASQFDTHLATHTPGGAAPTGTYGFTGISISRSTTGITVGPQTVPRPVDQVPFAVANIFIYSAVGTTGGGGGGGGGGSLGAREDVQVITANLAAGAGESLSAVLGAGFRVIKVKSDKLCRIRLYTSPAQRTADVGRPGTTDPPDYPTENATPNHGCQLELEMIAANLVGGQYVQDVAPNQILGSGEEPPVPDIAYRIDNTGAAATPITVTFTVQKMEE